MVLSTKEFRKVHQSDYKQIEADLKAYADAKMVSTKVGVGFSYEKTNDSQSEEEKDVCVNFHVTFSEEEN